MKDIIVLYPAMGRGHLVPMVELGKLISTHHHPTLSVTILLSSPPNTTTAEYIATVSAASPSIIFHHLPPSEHLLLTLQSISQSSKPKAFILDFFNHSAADTPARLNIPTYYFFPNAASCVALFLYTPTIHRNTSKGSSYLDMLRRVPGLPPLSPEDMPEPILDRRSRSYEMFVKMSIQIRKTDGFIVNTFEKLETKAFRALTNGACVPEAHTPPVYCVGPLISTNNGGDEGDDDGGCLRWLDTQPSRSVVYLSFGSYGRFSESQIREIAVGLERSGHRFLWVVRSPTPYERRELRLEELLPKGFLQRTKGRGMVVRNWAPQVAVLSHGSVDGFVTHCGWNSVLEAVSWGVPMLAWPLYAEQRMNRVVLVEEMKVALPLKENDGGFVRATELENQVRVLMDSERGKEVRERILRARNDAVSALADRGSSQVALDGLVELWKQK